VENPGTEVYDGRAWKVCAVGDVGVEGGRSFLEWEIGDPESAI